VLFFNSATDGLLDVRDIVGCDGRHDGIHVGDHGDRCVGDVNKVTVQNDGSETSVAGHDDHEVHIYEVHGLYKIHR
jgi:hypothetical protein